MPVTDELRVLELSRGPAAAFCGKLFVRAGADVLAARGPHTTLSAGVATVSEESLTAFLDTGKRLCAIDLEAANGYRTVQGLATLSDIVITDASPDDFDAMRLCRADGTGPLVVSITPFGLNGPYRNFEATPATLLALGGYTYLMGDPDREPLTMPGLHGYYQAALLAYTAALSSIHAAAETSEPVEVSIFETIASMHYHTTVQYSYNGIVPRRSGNYSPSSVLSTILPCKNGWVGLSVAPEFWEAFTYLLGCPELQTDARFASQAARTAHVDELHEVVRALIAQRTADELMVEGQESFRIPIAGVADFDDLLADPHLEARGFWSALALGNDQVVQVPRSPYRFNDEIPHEASATTQPQDPNEALNGWQVSRPHAAPFPRRTPTAALTTHGPLSGIRVLEITANWAGPLTGRILADLGADVIKVESARARGSAAPAVPGPGHAIGGSGERPWNQQGSFNKLNRNKRSLALDLKRSEGRELFLRVVARSDVVLENFSARAFERLGLGYNELVRMNPRIIYLAMPAFGRSGPYGAFVAFGHIIEPASGLSQLMGYPDGIPHLTTMAIPDSFAGTYGASAVLTALRRRASTGMGAALNLSHHEAAIDLIGEYIVDYQRTGTEIGRIGNGHPEWAPHDLYPCAGDDQWIAIAIRSDPEWQTLSELAGRGWADDPKFGSLPLRRQNASALRNALAGWTRQFNKYDLMQLLENLGIPAGAALSAPDLLSDPHLRARSFFARLEQPDVGPIDYPGSPVRLGSSSRGSWQPAPTLGQHNAEVLRELLGLSDAEIETLTSAGVLTERPSD